MKGPALWAGGTAIIKYISQTDNSFMIARDSQLKAYWDQSWERPTLASDASINFRKNLTFVIFLKKWTKLMENGEKLWKMMKMIKIGGNWWKMVKNDEKWY